MKGAFKINLILLIPASWRDLSCNYWTFGFKEYTFISILILCHHSQGSLIPVMVINRFLSVPLHYSYCIFHICTSKD